jgi:RNA-directed DNA polymerase
VSHFLRLMSRLAALKAANSLGDVARLLLFKPQTLSYVLYKQQDDGKYSAFQIPKRSGGLRTIHAPAGALKLLQRRLSDLLQDCADEITSSAGRKDRLAHGFKRQRSIITNARRHRNRRYVFNVDLEDFFPSINFGRVRGFLIKNRDFALHERVATVIAQIACHNNALPQGSPCSPVISNLVAQILDIRLLRLAAASGCTYSRYADDLTFSTNHKEFPFEIAIETSHGENEHRWSPSKRLTDEIERSGFRVNEAKVHLMYRRSRQAVTGLVVNQKINVRKDYRHNVRAMVSRLITQGTFSVYRATQEHDAVTLAPQPGSLDELQGMLGFIDSVDNYNREVAASRLSGSERVYRDFLVYRNFYAADKPVVLCEGDTDNIYLTHAIRRLAADFPQLASIKNSKILLAIRLYKYPRSSTARILELHDGGSGVLAKFIDRYRQITDRFAAPGQSHPVVILYDNDSGAKSIRSAIKQITKSTVDNAQPFVRVTRNLYAMPVPLGSNAPETAIEDCFDEQTRAIAVDGKTFDCGNNIDIQKCYGKKVFAHKVVKARADTIDFTGFRPLLANLAKVIDAHRESAAT